MKGRPSWTKSQVPAKAWSSSSGVPQSSSCGDGPGGLEDGDLVEEFAAPQAVVDEVALRADVHHDLAEVEALDPRLLGGHGAAVGDVRRGDGFVVDEQLARGRVEAVGREDQARLVDLTGGEGDSRRRVRCSRTTRPARR